MRRIVQITRKSDGRVLETYPIELRGLNYDPVDDEYFDEAFRAAVEDGLVDKEDRRQVRMEFTD